MSLRQSGYHGLPGRATIARLAGLLLLVLVGLAHAEDVAPPALPGVGTNDPRVIVDPATAPWRAVGRVQTESGNRCTGFMTGPSTVLTAAHCLFNHGTRHFMSPGTVHFVIGYQGGDYTGHAVAARYVIGNAYDPARPLATLGDDWAILTLAAPLGTPDRILKPAPEPPKPGEKLVLGGYGQDHAELINADLHCSLAGAAQDSGGRLLLRHNCTGTRGTSGAALLVHEADGKWAVIGIQVAAEMGRHDGMAVPIERVTPAAGRMPE